MTETRMKPSFRGSAFDVEMRTSRGPLDHGLKLDDDEWNAQRDNSKALMVNKPVIFWWLCIVVVL